MGADSDHGGDRARVYAVAVASASAALVCVLVLAVVMMYLLRCRKRNGAKRRGRSRRSEDETEQSLVMFYSGITYEDVVRATGQFDEEHVLSRTRHGIVFKACFEDGSVFCIRRLPEGQIGSEEAFRQQAEALGRIRNPNLTVLRGYCCCCPGHEEDEVRLLVYDYMPNGTLATLLQEARQHEEGHLLNWPMRHVIALGIARGLAHLHALGLVHGDVNPGSVHFDADFEAHLSDFGLDKLMPGTADSKNLVGSFGYVAPEAKSTGQVTKHSDVYSFGIVLLELLTGRRAVMFITAEEDEPQQQQQQEYGNEHEQEDIVKWVKRQLHSGQISGLFDPGLLEMDHPESSQWEEFLLAVKVALLCTVLVPLDRPSMAEVVMLLEGCRLGAFHDLHSSDLPPAHDDAFAHDDSPV